MHYAGFWRRFVAYGMDASIVQLIAALAIWLLGSGANTETAADYAALSSLERLAAGSSPQEIQALLTAGGGLAAAGLSMGGFFIWAMASGIYNIWFVAGNWQATPGKRWCGIMVAMQDGTRPTLAQSALRWFAGFTSWASLGVGFMMAGWNREKCAMHDVICGTRVIYRPN